MRAVPEEEEDEERASPTTIITIATPAQAPTVDNCECVLFCFSSEDISPFCETTDTPVLDFW